MRGMLTFLPKRKRNENEKEQVGRDLDCEPSSELRYIPKRLPIITIPSKPTMD